jgi:predicted DNA-binding ribbon-helix-helix protein
MTRIRTKQLYKRQDGATSVVVKRSIVVAKHKTSVSLEDRFWQVLKAIQAEENEGLDDGDSGRSTLSGIVTFIDATKPRGANLSCAIRLYILDRLLTELSQFRAAAAPVKKAA